MDEDKDPIVREYESGHTVRLTKVTQVLLALESAQARGMTAREMGRKVYGIDTSGKSAAGGILTPLHKEGHIAALAEKREKSHVYVLLPYINGRDTWDGFKHHCATCTCEGRE